MNRYKNIKTATTDEGTEYKVNPIYPEIPVHEDDLYVITSAGDRYDTLAHQFYQDASLWWIIASVNTSERASLNVQPGVQLRIPGDKNRAIQIFRDVNKNR